MTSGSSYDVFKVTPEQEKAFKELLFNARKLRGWSQQQAADNTGVAQTVISSLERGPYPGMRLWDIWRLCEGYGIDVVDVRKTLGWYGEDEERATEDDLRIGLLVAAIKKLDRRDRDLILQTVERYIVGVRAGE